MLKIERRFWQSVIEIEIYIETYVYTNSIQDRTQDLLFEGD